MPCPVDQQSAAPSVREDLTFDAKRSSTSAKKGAIQGSIASSKEEVEVVVENLGNPESLPPVTSPHAGSLVAAENASPTAALFMKT